MSMVDRDPPWPWLQGSAAVAFLIAALAGVAVVLYFGFLRDTSEGNRFDPARAYVLAHAALISPEALGEGWSATAVDDFVDKPSPATDACNAMVAERKDFRVKLEANRAARASIELTRAARGEGAPATIATIEVHVYHDAAGLATLLDAYHAYLDGAEVTKCLQDALKQPNVAVSITRTSPLVAAAKGGIGSSYTVDVTAGGQASTMRVEQYGWIYGNAVVTVTVTGAKDDVTKDVVNSVVTQAQGGLDRVAATPPTPVPAASPTPQGTPVPAAQAGIDSRILGWGRNFCAIQDVAHAPQPPDTTNMTFDQAKAADIQYLQAWADRQEKQLQQFMGLQPPAKGVAFQEAYVRVLGSARKLHGATLGAVSAAATPEALAAAIQSFNAAIGGFQQQLVQAYRAAPPDVLAVASCLEMSPEMAAWGAGLCGAAAALQGVPSLGRVDIAGLSLEQTRSRLLQNARDGSDAAATIISQLQALKPPEAAKPVTDAWVQVVGQGKALYDAAIPKFTAARSGAELSAAAVAVDTGIEQQIMPALGAPIIAAPEEVRQALFLCQ